MKPCLNQNTLKTTPTETFLEIARKAEFDAVELTMSTVTPIIEKNSIIELKRSIEDNGLTVASINGPENFNLLTEEAFATLLTQTRKVASAILEIECNLLIPVPSINKNQQSREAIITQAAQSLNSLSEACGERINLGLEFLGEKRCSINNLKTAEEVIDAVAKTNVGLVLDTFHMHLSNTAFSELSNIQKHRIFLVHINDSEEGDTKILTDANRLLPGDGVMHLEDLKTSLARVQYNGFLSLELFKESYWKQDPLKVAQIGRESIRRTFGI